MRLYQLKERDGLRDGELQDKSLLERSLSELWHGAPLTLPRGRQAVLKDNRYPGDLHHGLWFEVKVLPTSA